MIEGYDDYHERAQRGLPAYTQDGLLRGQVPRKQGLKQEKDARIKKLEEALIEERAKRILLLDTDERLEIAGIEHCPDYNEGCQEECYLERCPSKEFWLGIARQQLADEERLLC